MATSRPSPLRARRLLRGETLFYVARALEISEPLLSLLERGQRRLSPPTLEKFAALYQTDPSRLQAEMQRWCAAGGERPTSAPLPPTPPPGGWAA
jgi:transcriptional regulator with XRE-family HTH domain